MNKCIALCGAIHKRDTDRLLELAQKTLGRPFFCGSKKSPTCSFSKFQSRTCKQSQMAACTLADIVCLRSLVSNSPNTKSPMAACMLRFCFLVSEQHFDQQYAHGFMQACCQSRCSTLFQLHAQAHYCGHSFWLFHFWSQIPQHKTCLELFKILSMYLSLQHSKVYIQVIFRRHPICTTNINLTSLDLRFKLQNQVFAKALQVHIDNLNKHGWDWHYNF